MGLGWDPEQLDCYRGPNQDKTTQSWLCHALRGCTGLTSRQVILEVGVCFEGSILRSHLVRIGWCFYDSK
ncbi:hypothetical protein ACFDR8_000790 [Arthrobacter sp. MP_2.3]